jgi:predicted DNA-binding protein YlxM (UPF0122 family)
MDVELFSIKKIADQLNVSRQTIYNKIDELQLELNKYLIVKNNVKYLKLEAIDIIKDNIKNQLDKSIKNTNDLNSDYKEALNGFKELHVNYTSNLHDQIKHLQSQVNEKDNQLNEKDKQLNNKDIQLIEKDKQLNSKDELLRNFQFLLKNEQENNIKLLENNTKLLESKTNKDTIWNKIFGSKKI